MKFAQKINLKIHIEGRHERKKPQKCEICSTSFVSKYLLKLHFDEVHGDIETNKKRAESRYTSLEGQEHAQYQNVKRAVVDEEKVATAVASKYISFEEANQSQYQNHEEELATAVASITNHPEQALNWAENCYK